MSSTWWFQNWTGNQVQSPRLHFSASYLHMWGAQEAPRELRDICISACTPLGYLSFHKNKQPGNSGRSSLPCPEKSSHSALWGSSFWPCLSWILPEIPTCSRSCRGKSLLCPWHYCRALSLSPFWLHVSLEQLFLCLLCPESTVLLMFCFFPCSLWNL